MKMNLAQKSFLLFFVMVLAACTSPQTVTPPPADVSLPTVAPAPVATIAPAKQTTSDGRIRVTFINPGISDPNNPTGTYWLAVSAFMKAAAEDLNIDLEIIYSERDHILMRKQAKDVAARPNPPDYVIVVNEKQAADEMVQTLDKAGIKVFVMLNTFVGDQATAMGKPREKYPNWIGSLIPDNRFAGYTIAKRVIDQAIEAGRTAKDGKVHVVAISGDYVTPASIDRNNGLQDAIKEYGDKVKFEQDFVGMWSKDTAKEQMAGALKRYPEVSAAWVANDPMALGALEAIQAAGKTPGKDIMVGGLNWDPPALEKIQKGEMVTSVGGHFMTGAWTLVLLYDYHHGKDFLKNGSAELQYPIFGVLDNESVGQYLDAFGKGDWSKIDFTKFSKTLSPDVKDYDFSIDAVFRNITK